MSLGLGLTHFDTILSSRTQFFHLDSLEHIWVANLYLPETVVGTASSSVDGTDLGLSGGFLWRISDLWRVGGFFREGPELRIGMESRAGPHWFTGLPEGALLSSFASDFDFPDVYGVGLTYRSSDGSVTVSFEWDRVEYSTILDSLGAGAGSAALDDADELHLGGEYVFLRTEPVVAARLGAWLDPDHRVRQTGDDRWQGALFQPGDDQLHLAGGLGLVFRTVQVDLGVDLSDTVDTVSLSGIYSF